MLYHDTCEEGWKGILTRPICDSELIAKTRVFTITHLIHIVLVVYNESFGSHSRNE